MSAVLLMASYLVLLLYTVFPFLLLRSFLPMRSFLPAKIAAFCIFSFISGIVIYPNDPVNIIYAAIGFLVYMILFYRGRFLEKLSVVMILYPVIVVINFLTEDVGMLLFQATGGSALTDDLMHLAFQLLRVFLWLLILHILKDKLSQAARILTLPMWVVVDTICLASFCGIITMIIFSPTDTYAVYPACLACLVTALGSVYLVAYISNTLRESLEMQNLKLQQSYYQELEQNQLAVRKLHHDMKNHLHVIGTFLEEDKKEEARAYFNSLSGQFEVFGRVFCKNSIVNAILNAKYNLALQHKIDTFFRIDLGNLLAIDDISLCSLFSNTLDNAIEAASVIEDTTKRKLSVKSRFDNGYFSYEIRNSRENELHETRGRLITSKPEPSLHGFGLQNVRDIVENYNGTISVTHTEDTFTVVILIGNLL